MTMFTGRDHLIEQASPPRSVPSNLFPCNPPTTASLRLACSSLTSFLALTVVLDSRCLPAPDENSGRDEAVCLVQGRASGSFRDRCCTLLCHARVSHLTTMLTLILAAVLSALCLLVRPALAQTYCAPL